MRLAEYEGVGLDWTRGCQGGYHGGFFVRRSSWVSSFLVTLLLGIVYRTFFWVYVL